MEHAVPDYPPGDGQGVRDLIETLRQTVSVLENYVIPQCICPKCEDKDENCETCAGTGWLSKARIDQLGLELDEAEA